MLLVSRAPVRSAAPPVPTRKPLAEMLASMAAQTPVACSAPRARTALMKELDSLRRDLQEERCRSRELAERMREQLRCVCAEGEEDEAPVSAVPAVEGVSGLGGGAAANDDVEGTVGSAPMVGEDKAAAKEAGAVVEGETKEARSHERVWENMAEALQMISAMPELSMQDLRKIEAVSSRTALLEATVKEEGEERGNSGWEEATEAATALAMALHEGVRGLMKQGMEFQELAAQREEELKMALAASEAIRARTDVSPVACNSRSTSDADCSVEMAVPHGSDGVACDSIGAWDVDSLEEAGLAIAERAVDDAMVARLEAQVRALEMQVECMGCELQSVQLEAQEWRCRHDAAEIDVEALRKEQQRLIKRLQAVGAAATACAPAAATAVPLAPVPVSAPTTASPASSGCPARAVCPVIRSGFQSSPSTARAVTAVSPTSTVAAVAFPTASPVLSSVPNAGYDGGLLGPTPLLGTGRALSAMPRQGAKAQPYASVALVAPIGAPTAAPKVAPVAAVNAPTVAPAAWVAPIVLPTAAVGAKRASLCMEPRLSLHQPEPAAGSVPHRRPESAPQLPLPLACAASPWVVAASGPTAAAPGVSSRSF